MSFLEVTTFTVTKWSDLPFMPTRAARMDQLEKVVGGMQTEISGLKGSVAGLQYSMDDKFAVMQASIDSKFALLLAKISPANPNGDASTPPPPPPETESVPETPIVTTGESAHPAQIFSKMDLPTSDGQDPLAWLARADQYFLVHNTPPESKLQLALIAMGGAAMSWIQLVLRHNPKLYWEKISQDLLESFGDDSAINSYEALHTTRQTGTLEDYISVQGACCSIT